MYMAGELTGISAGCRLVSALDSTSTLVKGLQAFNQEKCEAFSRVWQALAGVCM